MKLASVSQTKNQLSALLEQIRQGEVVVITDHDRPVAKITAITHESDEAAHNGIAQLERKGLLRRGRGGCCELNPPVILGENISAVATLLEDRELGR